MPEECIQEKLISKLAGDINKNCIAIKTKVPWIVFTLIIGALFLLVTGGYQYTYSTDQKTTKVLTVCKEKIGIGSADNSRRINVLDAERHLNDYKYKKIDEKLQDIIDITTKNLKQSQENKAEIQKLKWKFGNE